MWYYKVIIGSMVMSKIKIVGIVVIVVIVGVGYLISSSNNRSTPHSVSGGSVGVVNVGTFSRSISYAPYYVAIRNGWFDEVAKKHNTTIKFTEFETLPSINEAFATGNIDVIFEAEPPAIIGKAAGIDMKINGIWVADLQEIIVPTNSSIQTVKDLKGKKIGVLAGSSSHYGIGKVLEDNGLSLQDVEIVDMIPPDGKAAFASGSIDAWAIWPPFIEQEEVAGIGRVLPGADVLTLLITVARNDFTKQHPAIARDIVDVFSRAQNWTINNEQATMQIVAEELGLPMEIVERAWPKHDFKPSVGNAEIAYLQAIADFLYSDLKFIDSKINVQSDLLDL